MKRILQYIPHALLGLIVLGITGAPVALFIERRCRDTSGDAAYCTRYNKAFDDCFERRTISISASASVTGSETSGNTRDCINYANFKVGTYAPGGGFYGELCNR